MEEELRLLRCHEPRGYRKCEFFFRVPPSAVGRRRSGVRRNFEFNFALAAHNSEGIRPCVLEVPTQG